MEPRRKRNPPPRGLGRPGGVAWWEQVEGRVCSALAPCLRSPCYIGEIRGEVAGNMNLPHAGAQKFPGVCNPFAAGVSVRIGEPARRGNPGSLEKSASLNKDTIWWHRSRRQEHRQILIAWVSCRQPPKTSGSLTEARGDFLRAAPSAEYLRTHSRLQAAPGGSGDGRGRIDAP